MIETSIPELAARLDKHALATIVVDGRRPVSQDLVNSIASACDRIEESTLGTIAVVTSGYPVDPGRVPVALVSKWERALRRLERLHRPTVGVATGTCGGTALDALLTTDVRIATAEVRLCLPVSEGLPWPGMASFRLAQQVPLARIRSAVLFGRPIDAIEASDWGLIDLLTDDPAVAFARTVDSLGITAHGDVAVRRQLMFESLGTSFDESLGAHLAACDRELRRLDPSAAR
jgi:isomerase DpgB